MVEHESELQNKDLIAFLVATATLNYIPKNSEKLYEVDLLVKPFIFVYKSP